MTRYSSPRERRTGPVAPAIILAAALALAPQAAGSAPDAAAVERGAYIFEAADCVGCHTDAKNEGKRLAGGRALTTPFGIFYSPNITPDREHGIGKWTDRKS